jgi:hypothetical protein
VANLAVGCAYALQIPWALNTWPLPTGRLSYVFIGSILAAIAAGTAWLALSGETGSLPAGFLDIAITFGGAGVYLLATPGRDGGAALLPYAAAAGIVALTNSVLFVATDRRRPTGPAPRLPPLVHRSFVAFTAILLAVGGALILRVPGVMPWPLDPDMSVVLGFVFVGNAAYFGYAVLRPRWDSARAQLWSFLAYDAVLLGPLLAHYGSAPPELRRNVLVYAAVLVYSGALALYCLVLNPSTRGWGRHGAGEWAGSTS